MLGILMVPTWTDRTWRLVSFLTVIGVAFLAMAGVAGAEELEPSTTIVDIPAGATFAIAPIVITSVLGTLLPILNGIVLKTDATSGTGALVNLATSALIVVLTYVTQHPVFDVSTVVMLFLTTFIPSVAAYRGLWKPLSKNPTPAGNSIVNLGPGFIGPSAK